jgi:sigma-E factor negative regulatory protein RseA
MTHPSSQAPRPGGADTSAPDHPHVCLSALADGDADALPGACSAFRDDAAARQRWHTYHLIGDVLRSDELASPGARDAAFLGRLRERLSQEPVPLAPAPAAPARSRLGWRAPAAVAAGFVVVAGVLVLTRGAPDAAMPAAGPTLAASPLGTAGQGSTLVVNHSAAPAAPAGSRPALSNPQLVRSGDQLLLRDAELDAYLRAHQAARGGAALALPGGVLRNVDVSAPAGLADPAGVRR